MTLLVQITDTHILPPGELLYGEIDTARHLQEAVAAINRMRPRPDVVMVTGDLVERNEETCYRHFIDLVTPVEMPLYVIPGNHDYPDHMLEIFAGTPYFPASKLTYQYVIDDFPFRILALNSHLDDTELPGFDAARLLWLHDNLRRSKKPTLIAIHHPPMRTGIEFLDMGGTEWFQGLKEVIMQHPQVKLVICGHCHTDMTGRIGTVPVYMAGAVAHQLVAARGADVAPASINEPVPPVLHHYLNDEFVSGSHPWPAHIEEIRIDRKSGISWEKLKRLMRGSLN